MKSKKTRKHTVRIAQALALSAFLLAAPAVTFAEGEYSNKTAEVHDGIVAGGALYTDTSITFSSEDVELKIETNYAESDTENAIYDAYGAGFYAGEKIDLDVKSVKVSTNSVDVYAGVLDSMSVTAGGGALFAKNGAITFRADDVGIDNNSVTSVSSQDAQAYGGAIYASSDVILTGTESIKITANNADVQAYNGEALGGAVYSAGTISLSGAQLSVTGNSSQASATVQHGSAAAGGGALIATGDIKLIATDSLDISQNSSVAVGYLDAVAYGGAIYLADRDEATLPTVKVSADVVTIEQNYAYAYRTYTGDKNDARGYGGAISAYNGQMQIDARVLNIRGNSVDVRSDHLTIDGHVYAFGGALSSLNAENQGYTIRLTAESIDISDNRAVGNVSWGPLVYGGALAAAGRVSITAAASLDISRNTVEAIGRIYAYAKGGAIYTNTSVDISVEQGTLILSQNSATIVQREESDAASGGDEKDARGGAVYSSGDIALTASLICLEANNVSGTNTKTANADKGYGGALYSNAGNILLTAADEVLIRDNTVSIASTTANDLYAYGGALYATNGTVVISTPSADLSGNSVTVSDKYNIAREHDATAWGGLMVAKDLQLLSVESLSLKDNHAIAESLQIKPTALGGALYISGGTTVSLMAQSLDVSGNSVRATTKTTDSNNSAVARGGAIYTVGNLSLTGTDSLVLRGNSADIGSSIGAAQGGAIWSNGAASLSGGTLTVEDNKTSSSGGAVWAKGAVALTADTVMAVSGNIASNARSGAQGGAFASSADKVSLTAGTLLKVENNLASGRDIAYGGAVYAGSGIELTVAGGEAVLKGNYVTASNLNDSYSFGRADAYGGVLYAESGTLALSAQSFDFSDNGARSVALNWANAKGGAIYSSAALSITNTKVINLTANSADAKSDYSSVAQGGAIWAGGAVLLSADTIAARDNVTFSSHSESMGGVVYSESNVTLEGVSIDYSGNVARAVAGSAKAAKAYGGAIYTSGTAHLTAVEQISLVSNSADVQGSGSSEARGGALWAEGDVQISADMFVARSNMASSAAGTVEGGALYSASDVTLEGMSIDFSGNSVNGPDVRGGAVYAEGTVTMTATENIVLTANSADSQNSTVNEQGGGAIWSDGSVYLTAGNELTVSQNTATAAGNGANTLGGAVYSASDVTLEAASIDFSDNGVKVNGYDALGGAIYAVGTLKLENTKNFSLTSNSADARGAGSNAQGGALWVGESLSLNVESLVAHGNYARITEKNTQNSDGALGGAIYTASGVTLESVSIDFSSNGVIASGNYPKARGGAIYAVGDVELSGTEVTFAANRADAQGSNNSAQGGAIYSKEGAVTLESNRIALTDNEAFVSGDVGGSQGGAIYSYSDVIELTGGEVELTGNAARSRGSSTNAQGGAIYSEEGDITISGSSVTLTANSVDGMHTSQGGAIYAEDGNITLTSTGDLTVEDNIALSHIKTAAGGALSAFFGSITLESAGTLSLENNIATTSADSGAATGGAIYAYYDAVGLSGTEAIKLIDNKAQATGDNAEATGGAIHGEDAVTMSGGTVTLTGNSATVVGDGGAAYGGGVYAPYNDVDITGTSITLSNNFASTTGSDGNAWGGTFSVSGALSLTADDSVLISGNYASTTGSDSTALAGVLYCVGDTTISGTSITVKDNYASATGTGSKAWGGAFLVGGDLLSLTANDSILFSGNYAESGTLSKNASLGGAIYAINGVEMTAKSLTFATATDDVLARNGGITINGALTAVPGTSFTAGGQFAMGADAVSTLTLMAQPFTENADERKPGDLTIFGGGADTANGAENAIDFKRASLILNGASELTESDGRMYADVATVLYKSDPQLITGGNSADITDKNWAMDVSAYRNGKLYIHNAITFSDEQTEAIQEKLELGYTAKLMLCYDRQALIWRAQNATWNEAVGANTAWVQASDDIYTPYVEEGSYIADSFWRGDIVVFDGKVYDKLTPGSEFPASGDIEVPVDASGVVPAEVNVIDGQYRFTGGALSTGKLFVCGGDTSADFENIVNAALLVSVDHATVSFAELAAHVSTPVEISGGADVRVANVSGGEFAVSGAKLTLSGGSGSMTRLSLESGATLNVNALSSYSVTDCFSALDGSSTYFSFGAWSPDDDSKWAIGGGTTATLAGDAELTISGIANSTTGTWLLLNNFKSISADETAWSYASKTLNITGRDDLNEYVVRTVNTGTSYVLTITRPEGELIWNGTGSDVWSAGIADRPWLIASDDLDVPYEYEGRKFATSFDNGAIVTFNSVGKKQENVTVSGDVHSAMMRVTAGSYTFGGDGEITADALLIDDSRFGTGTKASFDVPVNVSELLESGADTQAWLAELNMGEETPANVSGTLELANVVGGVFTVNEGGVLTLSGGTGSLAGLTVNSGATLNVNALSSYSVTDSFSALGGSVTNFNFSDWSAGSGYGIGGGNSANLSSGAKLTITGISQGATGKWTLLSGFKNVTAGGWTAKDITITGYTLSGYVVKAYADGADYVLEITKEEPPTHANPGHTEVFHIAESVQSNVSATAESAALGQIAVEPDPNKHLWASMWRENGRVSDSGLIQKNRAYGLVIGRDLSRNEDKTWGVAAHIGKADTSGKGKWDGATSDTTFWGLMLYGRRNTEKWLFTGDAGMTWFRTDYTEAGEAKADNARATIFSIGGRAYYRWVDDARPGKMSVSPFVGLRWNRYRQSAYGYDSGDVSTAWTANQVLVPFGVKFAWGENVTPRGWRTSPSVELSYTRTFGDRSARTGIFSQTASKGVDTPLSDRDTFGAQVHFNAQRGNFHMDLNAGVRKSSSETNFNVGATFKWEL